MSMVSDLTIIIPTYNEERRILKTLDAYTSFFDKKLNCDYIITDQSTDKTRIIVRNFMKTHKNVHLLSLPGRGKGGAVIEGFKIAKGRLLGFTDADNATPPEEFYKLYMQMSGYDAVIGSRGLSRSHVIKYHQSSFRRLGSLVLSLFIVRFCFGLKIKDTQCGAKIFKREQMLNVIPKMKIKNAVFDIELLWRFSKVGRIKEFPIQWVDDEFSHFKWYDVIGEFVSLVKVRLGL